MNVRIIVLFLAFTHTAFSQSLSQKVAKAFEALENDAQLKYGQASLTVMNRTTGEIIFSKNGRTGLAPASTLKTVTSAAAYAVLGKDFTWKTSLGYSGTVSNGILRGDLVLKGSGDPSLGSDRYSQTKAELLLNRWSAAVKASGIKKIEGRVIVDDLLFGTQIVPLGWIWQDIGNYYGAGATSATWRENESGLSFKPGLKEGDPARLSGSEPPIAGLKIINEVITGAPGTGDNVYAYSAPFTDVVYVRGTYGIDLEKTIKVAVPDPARQLAAEFCKKLDRDNIEAPSFTTSRLLSSEKQALPESVTIIDTYNSPTLAQIVYWLNQKSLNLYAENTLKTIAIQQGRKGTFENGVKAVQEHWSKIAGIEANSLDILDGSGLSPENRVTTETMARILLAAAKQPWFESYLESFPLYNNMKMKSGSIRNVLCYAGYEKSVAGVPLVFSIITNNYNGSTSSIKQKIFKVLDTLK